MPRPNDINPRTGKRYNFVDPQKMAETFDRQLEAIKRQQAALEARGSLIKYSMFTAPDPTAPNDLTKSRYTPERFHRLVAAELERLINGELKNSDGSTCKQLIFVMPPRHGKACAHDTPVLTPIGWRQHGDLKPGDEVFGPDGKPTKILRVSADVDEVVPVHLSNGEVIRCHLNHEWMVYDRVSRHGWRVMETREIASRRLHHGPKGARGGRYCIQLPDAEAVQFPTAMLPMHPYALGAWLGDGNANAPRIAFGQRDTEVVEAVAACGYEPNRIWSQVSTRVGYATFAGPHPSVASDFWRQLRVLKVVNNKHIPELYLRSSIEQRLQLLAGLVDTDGHVERNTGRVRFSTCSPELRDGVYDLAAGLGFRPYIAEVAPTTSSSGIEGKKVTYQVGFQPTMPLPTRIPRKQILKFAKRRRIAITHVGPVEKAGARSIWVDRPDGLYLVGKQLVVTKNTQLTTKNLTAWISGRHPNWDIGVASYSDTMATDMGADTRAILTSTQHKQVFPNYRLRKGGSAKDNIQTDQGGRLVFVGRGGTLTGRGMNVGIGDDLFKDHEEARSQAIRDAAWNWFTKVFMTRRMDPKIVILTFTRWHSDDIIGRITDPENPCYNPIEAAKWKIIKLPAIAEEDDPLGREPGEALWPEKYDLDFLQSQQRLDPLGFAALYQQSPTVADGTIFRRENIRRYHPNELPEDLRFYCTSDHAVGTNQRNDLSCFGKAGVDKNDNLWLTDIFWERVPTDVAVEAMLSMAGGKNKPLLWWAERGHISKSIGPFLHKRMLETGTYINLVEITPVNDKQTRAQSIAARVAMGKVYIPHGPKWDKLVEQMLAFPNGTHDDGVDMLSLFGLGLGNQFAPGGVSTKPKPKEGSFQWLRENDKAWERAKRAASVAF